MDVGPNSTHVCVTLTELLLDPRASMRLGLRLKKKRLLVPPLEISTLLVQKEEHLKSSN